MTEHKKLGVSDLSDDQRAAYLHTLRWIKEGKKLLTLGGFAGSGKSTVVSVLATCAGVSSIAFCALTGKAAGVLRKKLAVAGVDLETNYCGTIHSLIYSPDTDKRTGAVKGWMKRAELAGPYKLLVVDEASMVDETIFKDLQSYGIPILAVGDHGQLPPVSGSFSLMQAPEIRLEKIHRQAADNPIIRLSAAIRETGRIPEGASAPPWICVRPKSDVPQVITEHFRGITPERLRETAILCYTNGRRNSLNDLARRARWGSALPHPVVGEQVICLRNVRGGEDGTPPLYNGMRGMLATPGTRKDKFIAAKVAFPDEDVEAQVEMCQFQFGRERTFSSLDDFRVHGNWRPRTWREVGLLFDFGYAMTTHKSQGSSFRHLFLVAERPGAVDAETYKRWLYTSATRSSEFLTVFQ